MQTMVPIAVLLPLLGFLTPMKNRKQAIVISSKNIIIARQATRKIQISTIKLTDVKSINIRKIEGGDAGQVSFMKTDDTRQTVYHLASINDFEAALVHAQFEGKLSEVQKKLVRNFCTRNFTNFLLGWAIICALGIGGWYIIQALTSGWNWLLLWGGTFLVIFIHLL